MNKYDEELLEELKTVLSMGKKQNVVDVISKAVRIESDEKLFEAGQMSSKKILNGLKKYKNKIERKNKTRR